MSTDSSDRYSGIRAACDHFRGGVALKSGITITENNSSAFAAHIMDARQKLVESFDERMRRLDSQAEDNRRFHQQILAMLRQISERVSGMMDDKGETTIIEDAVETEKSGEEFGEKTSGFVESTMPPAQRGDDLFGESDKAVALERHEFIKKGLIKPKKKMKPELEVVVDELEADEVMETVTEESFWKPREKQAVEDKDVTPITAAAVKSDRRNEVSMQHVLRPREIDGVLISDSMKKVFTSHLSHTLAGNEFNFLYVESDAIQHTRVFANYILQLKFSLNVGLVLYIWKNSKSNRHEYLSFGKMIFSKVYFLFLLVNGNTVFPKVYFLFLLVYLSIAIIWGVMFYIVSVMKGITLFTLIEYDVHRSLTGNWGKNMAGIGIELFVIFTTYGGPAIGYGAKLIMDERVVINGLTLGQMSPSVNVVTDGCTAANKMFEIIKFKPKIDAADCSKVVYPGNGGNELFVYPGMGIIANVECESCSRIKNDLANKGFDPVRVRSLSIDGYVVVEFNKEWSAFYGAIKFEKEFKIEHHEKKNYYAASELRDGLYGWKMIKVILSLRTSSWYGGGIVTIWVD